MGSRRTAEERSRRRFARRQWARRWITWRYVLVAVVVLGIVGGGVYAVYFSRALSVQGVEVVGEDTISEDEILQAAAVPVGGPLLTADLDAIADRVENILAAVATAEVTRSWPHDVRIDIEERVAVAVVDEGGTFTAVDSTGKRFSSFKRVPAGLPLIEAVDVTDAQALTSAAAVLAAVPAEVRSAVDHLEVGGPDEIDLVLDGDRTVRWGSAEDSQRKAEVLVVLLQQPGTVYDVTVPGQPAVSG